MDALKKAEASKRQADAQTAPGHPAELTLEPVSSRSAKTSAPPAAAADEAAERAAARQLFAAKQPAPTRQPIILFIGFAILAALLITGYFWWQLQAGKHSSLAPAGVTAAPTPATLPPDESGASAGNATPTLPATPRDSAQAGGADKPPLADKSGPGEEMSVGAAKPAAANAALAAAAGLVAVDAAAADARPAARRSASRQPATSTAAAGESEQPLRLSSSGPRTDTLLTRAYLAVQEGRTDEAQRDYELALQRDPRSLDALLGLALVASRQGRYAQAEALYLRALEANPADPDAQAGLINLRAQGDPLQAESRLKILLSGQPESAALNFALGNVLSRQSRWAEAQQSYFRAWTAAPDNADIVYNLAVSLDHLRQSKLAAQHYRMALDASARRPAAFDSAAVQRRIAELQP
ncbi:tetratricopeptide repeat protein [Rhodocyclus tenuis]|uniref:Tetratricopeptide (TPR) repeat protein n=1 Tax=Rhodocyclus tenuis TaxID=1066 RepID=A0A840G3D7_RHOTE|nr:tetratricopeptide repeat protein [Rhodocyclus tenuis]MBB4246913.1 tetratricopeptide (TPR) repeat protein [Rhodocyclus tenuis]